MTPRERKMSPLNEKRLTIPVWFLGLEKTPFAEMDGLKYAAGVGLDFWLPGFQIRTVRCTGGKGKAFLSHLGDARGNLKKSVGSFTKISAALSYFENLGWECFCTCLMGSWARGHPGLGFGGWAPAPLGHPCLQGLGGAPASAGSSYVMFHSLFCIAKRRAHRPFFW